MQNSKGSNSRAKSNSSKGSTSLHFGLVTEAYPNGTARVRFPDLDGLVSMPISVLHQNTFNRIWYWMPEPGQKVACLMDERGEQGVILAGVYTEANPPPVQDLNKFYFKFGAIEIEGDITTGVVKIDCTKLEIVSTVPSTLQGEEIVIIGGMDNDSETNGADTIVSSGQ